jgi:XTP/dITP diphosphohydrolase
MRILFASHNANKAKEVAQILANGTLIQVFGDEQVRVEPLSAWGELPEPPENAPTFIGNALDKARFIHRLTGELCLADDSGLAVDSLGGAPGVHSKRFSPEATAEANNRLLLHRLDGIADRSAAFVCALALVGPQGEVAWEGTCEGAILFAPRGAGGFGYDPLFEANAAPGRSFAELSPEEKNRISHRGRAMAQLPERLARLLRNQAKDPTSPAGR